MSVITQSVQVLNLCVPCCCRCRYCLLAYDGNCIGVEYERSKRYCQGFFAWLNANKPQLRTYFTFGYSMQHPQLLDAVAFMRSTSSPGGRFLQFNGMPFRNEEENRTLLGSLKQAGIESLDFTFYGQRAYHDEFAARKGDYDALMSTVAVALKVGFDVTASLPLTQENYLQTEQLVDTLAQRGVKSIFAFIPNCNGRGALIEDIRLTARNYDALCDRVKSLLNPSRYKTEAQWLQLPPPQYNKRTLTLSLTKENIDEIEAMPYAQVLAYLEQLDDEYYSVMPSYCQLALQYGNASGEKLYRQDDLYHLYEKAHIAATDLKVRDVHDQRYCFSVRY